MTARADFTEQEWTRLGRAPLVAGMAITLADPGGPFEAVKESTAALGVIAEAAREEGGFGPFVRALAKDVAERASRRENPMAGFRPTGSTAREEVLAELRGVHAVLVAKADPADVGDFREWIKTASQRAALAAKEGGFLGIGGQLVSEREQRMLDTLGEIFERDHGDRVPTPPAERGAGEEIPPPVAAAVDIATGDPAAAAATAAATAGDDAVAFATIDRDQGEMLASLRRPLGVGAFGMNVVALQPGERGRVHRHERQEEVYVVLEGELTLLVEGAEHVIGPDGVVRVGAAARRQLVNRGDVRVVLLALGGTGEHAGRDGLAWTSFDEGGPGRPPQEIPLPEASRDD